MTFDPAWFAAIVSTGALVVLAFSNLNLQLRVYKVETKLMEHELWLKALVSDSKGKGDEGQRNCGIDGVPPGTRMPEMDERKS
jgi:hypothetical protein